MSLPDRAASVRTPRPPRPQHVLEVLSSERIAPSLVRVRLGGAGMATFTPNACTDAYVKLLFVKPELGLEPPYDLEALREMLAPDDLPRLLGDDPVTRGVLEQARGGTQLDARAERAARKEVLAVVKDPVLARRLVAAGVTDPKQARKLVQGRDAAGVDRVERAAGIGASLQALEVAASHIATLVAGLRQHARPDGVDGAQHLPTDVHETVRSALLLLGHRLTDVTVSVKAKPGLPLVLGTPADLVQVWTNLVTNAVDALDNRGTVKIRLDAVTDDRKVTWVRVRVEDDGPGVPEELQPHVFEPRFTTKHGVVRFGLGLGLGIAHTIVHDHSGAIGLESRPGRTVFEVRLPAMEEER